MANMLYSVLLYWSCIVEEALCTDFLEAIFSGIHIMSLRYTNAVAEFGWQRPFGVFVCVLINSRTCHAHMIFVLTQQVFYAPSALFYCSLCLSLLESLQEAFSTCLSIVSTKVLH